MADAVIVAAARSPIGRAHKGSLTGTRPDDLLGAVMRHVVESSGLEPEAVDDVIVGCAMPYGEAQPMNVTRGAAFLAGLPNTVPAATVNRFCASSLEALRMAFHAVKSDEATAVLVGGVESVSRASVPSSDTAGIHPKFVGGSGIAQIYMSMGETAENVADRYMINRKDMDRFAQRSQERAVSAQKRGVFEREILPISTPEGALVSKDDGPRTNSTLEGLARLEPVFRDGGRVTAGNSCPLNDGAAAVLVMSADCAKRLGQKPMAQILGSATSGIDPAIMGVGPIEAVKRVLKRTGLSINDIGVFELNEAFASQVLAVCSELDIDPFSDQLNPHGGAIALGHPFGMTGARMMTTLINDLITLDREVGVETLCVGGGMGVAMAIRRLN